VSAPRLDGRVAIVTGSTKGIGLEIARLFLDHGAKVVVNSRSSGDVADVVRQLAPPGREESVTGVPGNVASPSVCDRLVDTAVRQFGGVDILVNNAGISMVSPSLELSSEDWVRTLQINLSGPFYMSQSCARGMITRGGGSIVNISSILGVAGLPKRAAYCASKHGLIGLTKVLAAEWAHLGIRVNAISPGYIQTEMDAHDSVEGDYSESDILGRTPLARYGTTTEVAELALFLAGAESQYVTGANVTVDGGWTAYAGWDRLLTQLRPPP
jgi:3-oxoacyl-[acyl-carrier protein] reductase